MLTLTQIKQRLIDWFSSHAQINTVVFANDFEFSAERNLVYPVVNLSFIGSRINERMLDYSIKVKIGDLVSEDDTNLQDYVISDSILIAEDFFTFLQYEEGWVFTRSSTIRPLIDNGGDRISGVEFTVIVSVVRSQNTCEKPVRSVIG